MSDAAEPGPISQGLRDARAAADLVFRHFRHGPGPTDDAPLYQSSLPGSADLDDADLPSSQLLHQRLHQLNDADNNDIAVHADESGASFLFDTANSNNTLFTPWASQGEYLPHLLLHPLRSCRVGMACWVLHLRPHLLLELEAFR